LAENCTPKDQKALKKHREKTFFSTITPSYEKSISQNFNNFDKIAQNLDKFTRPANQDKYENYNTKSLCKIRTTVLKW
jgi:hypothetical protein